MRAAARDCVCLDLSPSPCARVSVRARVQRRRGARSRGLAPRGGPAAKRCSRAVLPQEQKFCQRYDQLMEAWEKKVERIESNPRRRAKESKVREYYEKQFPEIRKQRELQERMQR